VSTLKTISIQHPNSSSANIGLGTDGSVTVGTAMTLRSGEMNIVGVATATTFSGNITGTAATFTGNISASTFSGNVTGTAATFSGAITAASASFSGNVSIAGTLTYEDVTNVDAIGLVTARSGANITGGNLLVGTSSSTGTASQPLQVNGGAYVSGSVGIGTSVPATTLEVAGEYRLSPPLATPTANTTSNRQGVESANVYSYTGTSGTASFNSPTGYPFYIKKFFKMSQTATGALNQTLCEIDTRNQAFSELWIKIVWGTRIQGVSDGTSNLCERGYGCNKFNGVNNTFTISSSWSHIDANSDSHMDINVVNSGTGGILLVQYQQSSSVNGSSFIWGYMEICSMEEIGTTNIPLKFNC